MRSSLSRGDLGKPEQANLYSPPYSPARTMGFPKHRVLWALLLFLGRLSQAFLVPPTTHAPPARARPYLVRSDKPITVCANRQRASVWPARGICGEREGHSIPCVDGSWLRDCLSTLFAHQRGNQRACQPYANHGVHCASHPACSCLCHLPPHPQPVPTLWASSTPAPGDDDGGGTDWMDVLGDLLLLFDRTLDTIEVRADPEGAGEGAPLQADI
jgi:hypothetical protein